MIGLWDFLWISPILSIRRWLGDLHIHNIWIPRILLVECLQVSLSLCGFSSPTFVILFCPVTADPPSPHFPIGERGSLLQSAQSSAFLYTDCPDLGEVEGCRVLGSLYRWQRGGWRWWSPSSWLFWGCQGWSVVSRGQYRWHLVSGGDFLQVLYRMVEINV